MDEPKDGPGKDQFACLFDMQGSSRQRIDQIEKKMPEAFTVQQKLVGSEKVWGSAIFEHQFVSNNVNQASVSMVPYGVSDAVFVLEGQCVFYTVCQDQCPGDGLAKKVQFLESATHTDLVLLRTKNMGSFFKVVAGDFCCHPTELFGSGCQSRTCL